TGTSTPSITTPTSATTTITGLANAGTYFFRWTITNAPCSPTQDDMIVTRAPDVPVAAAGSDQTICTSTATMAGNAAAPGTGTWTFVVGGTGTSTPSITTPNSATTTITGLANSGTYFFRWTITNAPCAASQDDMIVTRGPDVTVAA